MSYRGICEDCGQYQKGEVYLTGENQDQDTFICNACIEGDAPQEEIPATVRSPLSFEEQYQGILLRMIRL